MRRVKKRYARKAFLKGLRARIACSETARATIQVLVTVKRGRIITSKVGDLVLAQRTVTVGPGGRGAKLKPSRKLTRRLPRRFKARVKVEARDQFGNRSVKNRKVKVKPGKKKRRRRGRN